MNDNYRLHLPVTVSFFFFNDPAPTEIYTLSLHDALPICSLELRVHEFEFESQAAIVADAPKVVSLQFDLSTIAVRSEGTRLNSSHSSISYAVFCLKKKKLFDMVSQYKLTFQIVESRYPRA